MIGLCAIPGMLGFQTQPVLAPHPPSHPQHQIPPWVWVVIIGGLAVDVYLLVILLRRLL
jgi:hypothetical protein